MLRCRAGVKRRLVDIGAHVLGPEGFVVAYTWDATRVMRDTLFLGVIEGVVEEEAIGRGNTLATDRYTIAAHLVVLGHLKGEAAEEAAENALRLFEAAVRASSRLTGVPGLPDGDTGSYRGVKSVTVDRVDGPAHSFPQPNQNASIEGWVDFDLAVTADIGGR